jgi:hypothetical protein
LKGESFGHYQITSYSEHENGAVSVRLLHLSDSFLPNIEVFAVPPEKLVPCTTCN